jgi:HEAT repeat protein
MMMPLIQQLADADAEVRAEAARQLGEMRQPEAVTALIAALADSHSKAQYTAFSALVKIGDARAAGPMIDVLLRSPGSRLWQLLKLNIGMRLRAGLLNMVTRGDTATADVLTEAIRHGEFDEIQRGYFIQLLGRTADARAVSWLNGLVLGDNDLMKAAAADALGWIGDGRAVAPLLTVLHESEPHGAVREVAAEALGRIGDRSALAPLIRALQDENEWVRRAAAISLGELGDVSAMNALGDALSDESTLVQDAAFEAIRRLSDRPFTASKN